MELEQIHNITFDMQETIVSANLISTDECVMLLTSGQVIQYKVGGSSGKFLFDISGEINMKSPCSLHTIDNIVVVVNKYGLHGYVHYPGKYNKLHIERGTYHSDITEYPIALYKNDKGVAHLVYGADWNHVQIMNLDTRQILTASKSLIEEGAEEKHLQFYKQHQEDNKLPWPSRYDYFYGEILMSPDSKNFLSKGWLWGSADGYKIYNAADFINNNRIKDKTVGVWEHENRAACWVDNDTIAVCYNPYIEGDENSTENSPIELILYNVSSEEAIITKKIAINFEPIMLKSVYYYNSLDVFIIVHSKKGTVIINSNGETLFRDNSFEPDKFHPELQLFLSFSGQTISVSRLK